MKLIKKNNAEWSDRYDFQVRWPFAGKHSNTTHRPYTHSNYMSLLLQSNRSTKWCFVSSGSVALCVPTTEVVHCVSLVANNLLHNPGRHTKGQFMLGIAATCEIRSRISSYKECTMRSRLQPILISRKFITYEQWPVAPPLNRVFSERNKFCIWSYTWFCFAKYIVWPKFENVQTKWPQRIMSENRYKNFKKRFFLIKLI